MIWDRAVDVYEVNVRIGQYLIELRVAAVDGELIADAIHLRFIAAADRQHVRIGMRVVDRNELGTKAKSHHCHIDGLCHRDVPGDEAFGGGAANDLDNRISVRIHRPTWSPSAACRFAVKVHSLSIRFWEVQNSRTLLFQDIAIPGNCYFRKLLSHSVSPGTRYGVAPEASLEVVTL